MFRRGAVSLNKRVAQDRNGGSTMPIELHRGRLIDHIQLVVKDLQASHRFYAAVLDVLGIPISGVGKGFFWADELVVSSADSEAALGNLTGRVHLAFQVTDRATVEAFHRVGLSSGGTDNGAPGQRPYHPGYYAAFLLDPDGNNIEAVFHGPARRSADSVSIRFQG
jgi:catechol 2,3-dioxygenase-like lactoylglutathione lyase family enzyme